MGSSGGNSSRKGNDWEERGVGTDEGKVKVRARARAATHFALSFPARFPAHFLFARSMQLPPLLPEEILVRVIRLARIDGLGVLLLGSLFAIFAATSGEAGFAVVGLLAAGAGAAELHGVGLLRAGEARGVRWLIACQPFLLLVIYGYCWLRLTHFEMPPIPEGLQETIERSAQQLNMTVEDYFRFVNRLTAQLVAVVATFYQSGMMVYYLRRRKAVERALTVEE